MKLNQSAWLLLLAIQSILLSGCATPAVWRVGTFARYCEPADPPNLKLSHSSQRDDVLVEYSETREEADSIQPRAYWLLENEGRIKARRKPEFLSATPEQGLVPIPLLEAPAADPQRESGRYAIVSTNGYAFTLYSAGKEEGSYELPVYTYPSGRLKQVLLTPPAVIADAAIIGGVVALVSLPWLWTSLNDWVH